MLFFEGINLGLPSGFPLVRMSALAWMTRMEPLCWSLFTQMLGIRRNRCFERAWEQDPEFYLQLLYRNSFDFFRVVDCIESQSSLSGVLLYTNEVNHTRPMFKIYKCSVN